MPGRRARPVIAKRHVEVARRVGAAAVSHGATGKGNDQVRFELAFAALAPDLEVISPWKDPEFLARFEGRRDLLDFAAEHDIPVEATAEKPYSSDKNLMHRSYEAGMLEDPDAAPPVDMFKLTRSLEDTPDTADRIVVRFRDAMPVEVEHLGDGTRVKDPVALLGFLNDIGGRHGIGRIDIVENRFVGIKSRGVYETPGGTILALALRDLEGIAMDREVRRLRDMLSTRFASRHIDSSSSTPRRNSRLRVGPRHVSKFSGISCWIVLRIKLHRDFLAAKTDRAYKPPYSRHGVR